MTGAERQMRELLQQLVDRDLIDSMEYDRKYPDDGTTDPWETMSYFQRKARLLLGIPL